MAGQHQAHNTKSSIVSIVEQILTIYTPLCADPLASYLDYQRSVITHTHTHTLSVSAHLILACALRAVHLQL